MFLSDCLTSSARTCTCLQAAPSHRRHEQRWRLAVAAGLLVGPFFPASNLLFYVGTFIGERLLYFPSGAGRAQDGLDCVQCSNSVCSGVARCSGG